MTDSTLQRLATFMLPKATSLRITQKGFTATKDGAQLTTQDALRFLAAGPLGPAFCSVMLEQVEWLHSTMNKLILNIPIAGDVSAHIVEIAQKLALPLGQNVNVGDIAQVQATGDRLNQELVTQIVAMKSGLAAKTLELAADFDESRMGTPAARANYTKLYDGVMLADLLLDTEWPEKIATLLFRMDYRTICATAVTKMEERHLLSNRDGHAPRTTDEANAFAKTADHRSGTIPANPTSHEWTSLPDVKQVAQQNLNIEAVGAPFNFTTYSTAAHAAPVSSVALLRGIVTPAGLAGYEFNLTGRPDNTSIVSSYPEWGQRGVRTVYSIRAQAYSGCNDSFISLFLTDKATGTSYVVPMGPDSPPVNLLGSHWSWITAYRHSGSNAVATVGYEESVSVTKSVTTLYLPATSVRWYDGEVWSERKTTNALPVTLPVNVDCMNPSTASAEIAGSVHVLTKNLQSMCTKNGAAVPAELMDSVEACAKGGTYHDQVRSIHEAASTVA